MIDLDALSDEELVELKALIETEIEDRVFVRQAQEHANAMAQKWHALANKDLEEGVLPAWTQPTGAHDAYPKNWKVTHNGSEWYSVIPVNVWEPGVSGWRMLSEDGSLPVWVQPSGAHDAYEIEEVVIHNGKRWRSLVNANVWEPPEQWEEVIDPVEEPPVEEPPVEEPPVPMIDLWDDNLMYFAGDKVQHLGKVWVSLIDANTSEPPQDWEDLGVIEQPPVEEPPAEPEIKAWSPTATYAVGDLVTHNGKTWRCLVAHGAEYQGTWAPGVAPTVWEEVVTTQNKAPRKP